ncbi:MAG TPA: hypothetical protein GX513_00525 [Firmicutes bacterium]|nr:hypothetical protein [Bacillota bacterium]
MAVLDKTVDAGQEENGGAGPMRAAVLRALAECAQKRGVGDARGLELLRAGEAETVGYFRYVLAREVSAFAGGQDPTLHSVYMADLDRNGDVEPSLRSVITLIPVVEEETAAGASLWDWIDERVTAEVKTLLGADVFEMGSLLDVHLVTEAQIKERSGFAALIGSLHTPALCVWAKPSPAKASAAKPSA